MLPSRYGRYPVVIQFNTKNTMSVKSSQSVSLLIRRSKVEHLSKGIISATPLTHLNRLLEISTKNTLSSRGIVELTVEKFIDKKTINCLVGIRIANIILRG